MSASTSSLSVARVIVYPFSYTLKLGQYKQLIAVPKDASGNTLSLVGRSVSWKSSNPAVATVYKGNVRARGAGTVTITATVDGVRGTTKITVKAPISVASVTLTPSSGSVQVGQYLQLHATPKDASGNPVSGQTVTWSSSNPAIAKVYSNGLVQAVSAGSVTISATAGGKTGHAAITVTTAPVVSAPSSSTPSTSDVASVVVYPTIYSLTVGQYKQMIAVPRDASGHTMSLVGRTVVWSSSNPAVATVSASGLVVAKSVGVVTIKATVDGTVGTAKITSALPY
ncbi:MAG TPA: Ig-like domain-containing protein [Longimicrobiaceae bacterium]|nr:Ig-like domain-containing protein [Longimicrobiaceae bacterium]